MQSVASPIADPGPKLDTILFVKIYHEIFSTAILLLLSVTSESMCTEYWLTPDFKLAQEKCG